MLSWRLHTGPEKAELQELNARLYDYVCRVQELERENLLLEEELRGRRGQEGLEAEGQARWAEEARCLRQQLDELSWATALAKGERDGLRRELRELQLLVEEARAARRRLDAELSAERRELQEALGARAALEAVLGRLQAERRGLDAAHERDVRELRARSAGLTLSYRARAVRSAAPPQRLQEVHNSYTLLVAESWRETVQLYEDQVRELEEALRRGQESRRLAEEERRLCAQEAEALQRQAQELDQLRARLEDELLRMRETYELQARERQSTIAHLEDEKAALTLAMADRLRDCQELVQAKTSLSLEVATYRALLEGESNPEILILTERIENLPQELKNTSYQFTNSVLQRENKRNLLSRPKAPLKTFPRSWAQSESQTAIGNAARRHVWGPGYPSLTTSWQEDAYGKTAHSQANIRTFSPEKGAGLSRNTEVHMQTFPHRPRTEGTKAGGLARESILVQESHQERRDRVVAGASESIRPNERTVIWGKKTEAQATREQERNRPGVTQKRREEKMFDSKEKASEERNLRWEGLTKLDKEARMRETQQMWGRVAEKESLKEKSVREREVPIQLDMSRDSTAEGTTKGIQIPLQKDTGGSPGRAVDTREMRFRLDTGDTVSPLKGDSVTETIAESIVSSVLKRFTQSPDTEVSADSFPDTKVTYVGRTKLPGDKKTKTEIVVESKLTEEIDVTDEAGLDYLLSKDVNGKVELKGRSTEQMIGDIVNLGLRGREGRAKVVNVEITEEPMSYVGGGEAHEVSTPFHVEEADDVAPGPQGLTGEEGYRETEVTFSASQRQKTKLPQENTAHVEEVTEPGDVEGEQSYFVSTPDEPPGPNVGRGRDEGSVYGQIHIEEESTIRYSWQDEIVPVSRRRWTGDSALGDKVVEPLDIPEPSLEGDVGSPHWIEETNSGEFHAETIVVEKEIKIPHEFHTSIKRDFKEPRHQLVEVIGQLEENLPAQVKEELSALTSESQGGLGSLSVDVKKVQTSGGEAVTLVAEVNLSQTVDADQLDLEELTKDEADEIEKAVESVVRDSLAKRHSPGPGSPERDPREVAPAAGLGFKRWATQELYRPSGEEDDTGPASPGTERATSQGPVSATVEVTSPRGFAQSHVLEDVTQSVRHIRVGPPGGWRTERVPLEGPAAGEVSGEGGPGQAASSEERVVSRQVRHFTLGPDQSQVSREIFFQGSVPASQEARAAEEAGPAELSADTDRWGSPGVFGSEQFQAQRERRSQGPVSGAGEGGDYFRAQESVRAQTSVTRLPLGPGAGLSEHVQVTVPLSDTVQSGVRAGGWSGASASIRQVTVGSQRLHTAEEMVPRVGEFSDSESSAHGEGSADGTQAPRSYAVGRTVLMTQKSTFQGVPSQSPQTASGGDTSGADETLGVGRSLRHVRLGPAETHTSERIVFQGPVSQTAALAGSLDPSERGESVESRTLRHAALGPKETSFTFQMDVSHVAATPSWTPEATVPFPAGTEAEAHSGAWRDAGYRDGRAANENAQGQAQAEFDRTVQLQRMVDQRSVVSDDKKVAVLYLDSQGGDDEGHWF